MARGTSTHCVALGLVAVAANGLEAFHEATADLKLESFGQLTESTETLITVN